MKWDKEENFSLLQRNLVRQAQNMNRSTLFLIKKSITALQIIKVQTYHTVKRVRSSRVSKISKEHFVLPVQENICKNKELKRVPSHKFQIQKGFSRSHLIYMNCKMVTESRLMKDTILQGLALHKKITSVQSGTILLQRMPL